ncbi:MAG: hypothetical protein OEX12_00070 [Gammaproteobacteria bacterium]|nr:hypothetical protein [Gammaproteobacteria bacterium]
MIAYNQGNGQIAICSQVSSVPEGAQYIETHVAPMDKLFRSAWRLGVDSIETDLSGAKIIAHNMRRAKREIDFAPYDEIIAKQIPGHDAIAAEAARADIRTADALLQSNIDACLDENTLRGVIEPLITV